MKYLTKNKHWDLVEDYNIDKILYLLIDRPNFTWKEMWINHDFPNENHKIQYRRNYNLSTIVFMNGNICRYDSDLYINNTGKKRNIK